MKRGNEDGRTEGGGIKRGGGGWRGRMKGGKRGVMEGQRWNGDGGVKGEHGE